MGENNLHVKLSDSTIWTVTYLIGISKLSGIERKGQSKLSNYPSNSNCNLTQKSGMIGAQTMPDLKIPDQKYLRYY